jgi:hypothetical protein
VVAATTMTVRGEGRWCWEEETRGVVGEHSISRGVSDGSVVFGFLGLHPLRGRACAERLSVSGICICVGCCMSRDA